MSDPRFLNVDLDLESTAPLEPVLREFGDAVDVLHHEHDNQRHVARLEHSDSGDIDSDPNTTAMALLTLVERLSPEGRDAWNRCVTRSFNFGFDSGTQRPVFEALLPLKTLRRLSDVGADFAITIYPIKSAGR